jgi:hypothetical protein
MKDNPEQSGLAYIRHLAAPTVHVLGNTLIRLKDK